MIKLVLTDLDDTLISHDLSADSASPTAMEAIRSLLAQGLHFGPVSGRTPASMGETFCGYAPAYATGAFANGQLVRLDGEIIHREYSPAEPLQRVADICDEQGDAALALYAMETDGSGWFVSKRSELPAFETARGPLQFGREGEVSEPSLKANIHLAPGTREHYTELRDLLRAEVPELDFVFPSNTAPIIDILPAGYGKGSAVRILARALDITLDEVATFGDSENDLSMLESIPNAVAVDNASAQVKAACRWHIGHAAEDAVAHALAQIAEAAATGDMPRFMQG